MEVNWEKTQIQSTIDMATLPPSVPVSTLAHKSIPLVAQNQKFIAGWVWPNFVLVSLTEEYGILSFPSLLKFSYFVLTFNRSFSMVLKHGHELWKTRSLPLTTPAIIVSSGFHTQIMLRMLMYDFELALHCNCCCSFRQDGSVSSGR